MLDLFLIKTTKDRLASLSHENKFSKTKRSDDNGVGSRGHEQTAARGQKDRVKELLSSSLDVQATEKQ